jgi:lambda repressor-like predicted transcriptional regulator
MTLTTPAVEEVIKTDVLGRMRTSVVRRESLVNEFEKSGLSAKKFAELSGIKYQTLATWLQKRRRQGKTSVKEADTVNWLEAVVEQAQDGHGKSISGLVLEFAGGARVEIRNANQAALAADLLRALAKSC